MAVFLKVKILGPPQIEASLISHHVSLDEDYLPSFTLTLDPAANTLPGFGLCVLTLPVLAVAPLSFLTLPSLQSAFLRLLWAALSFLPLSLGAVQVGVGDEGGAV